MEHSKAKDSLAELSPCIGYQLVPSPWHKCSSRAGLELATLLPQPKCWDFDNVSPHLAELHGLILFLFCFKKKVRLWLHWYSVRLASIRPWVGSPQHCISQPGGQPGYRGLPKNLIGKEIELIAGVLSLVYDKTIKSDTSRPQKGRENQWSLPVLSLESELQDSEMP